MKYILKKPEEFTIIQWTGENLEELQALDSGFSIGKEVLPEDNFGFHARNQCPGQLKYCGDAFAAGPFAKGRYIVFDGGDCFKGVYEDLSDFIEVG